MIAALDRFGRYCLAWPATYLGAALTSLGGGLLLFALWILDEQDDVFDYYDDY